MSLRQHDRLANESCMATEERDTRICRMSTLQRQRLDKQRLHQEERESSSQLVNNSLVQTKMRAFHGHFAPLTSPKCSTCLQNFPGLQLPLWVIQPLSACMHCCRDKHIPNVCSSANNMDLGPLPPQLQVSSLLTQYYITQVCIFMTVGSQLVCLSVCTACVGHLC